MPILVFTIGPSAVAQLHDILVCLAKFNEDISLEATQTELRISSLNIAKTAYAAFTLSSNDFFDKYHFSPEQRRLTESRTWTCKLQNRALAAVFRRRLADNREKDTGLEKCEFELQARPDLPECRLIIRLICRFGVVKTYRLTYENGENLHATFDKISSINTWSVASKTLQDVVEYFGPKTEQLDWYLNDGQVTFTSYTEKVLHGREILKQPMHTSVALKKTDFDDCKVEDGLHIGIFVKDFRAIVAHAETLKTTVTARYSRGNRPMQINYKIGGISSEFTLMTRGTNTHNTNTARSTPARDLSLRSVLQPAQPGSTAATSMTAPPLPDQESTFSRQQSEAPQRAPTRQNSPPPPSARINDNSLFIPADDDDQQWDAPNYEDEAPDFVTWDTGTAYADAATSMRRLRDSEPTSFADVQDRPAEVREIAPTQRLSQVRGLFD